VAVVGAPVAAELLLRRPIRYHGIRLGVPCKLVVDQAGKRALGLEIVCPDDQRRFLPWGALTLKGDQIAVESPSVLLDMGEIEFYEANGQLVADLVGISVMPDGAIVSSPRTSGTGSGQ
jgi:hypothetical protein